MKYRRFVIVLLAMGLMATLEAEAQQPRLIVRDGLGGTHLTALCSVLGCNVIRGLGDPGQQVFLVTPNVTGLNTLLRLLQLQTGIIDTEVDQLVNLVLQQPATVLANGLYDSTPAAYYGASVWDGYVNQPASVIVRAAEAQNAFHVSGSGIVAMIDTGIDPQHPALAPVALPGYDFTRNSSGADEKGDLDHSTAAVLDGGGGTPSYVTSGLAAVVPPLGAVMLANPAYAAFGHGTMTAGIVHIVAPTAQILPLKAFTSDGTGYVSNIVRAIYFAATHGSKVISMSFSFSGYSPEVDNAIQYVTRQGMICVAAAGNDDQQAVVYPASLSNVMGIASTSDLDTKSSFSNYGPQVVWVAAPGDNIVSTYPYATYSSSSGTSFSTPFVAGTAALLVSVQHNVNQSSAASAIAQAQYISSDLNHGRLDTFRAVRYLSGDR
jgi:subtilisin family serine protease